MRYFLIFLLAVNWCLGCKDPCLPSKEPQVKVIVEWQGGPASDGFRKVYAPDGWEVPFRENTYFLPVSLHADSVTYFFEGVTGKVDTLTILYTRRFFFESEQCGMVAEIENAGGQRSVRTTFQQANVVFSLNEPLEVGRRNIYEVRIIP
jgi:hypothetical protein